VETTDGLVGWGEGGQYGPSAPVATIIEEVLAPRLIGMTDPHPVPTWEYLYAISRDFGQKGSYIEAISALDIALWDLRGHELGEPAHALLGGAMRELVPAYATGCYYPQNHDLQPAMLDNLRAEAAGHVAAGFNMLKMKIGLLSVSSDAQRVTAVREAIGPDVGLLVDANHAYNSATAIRMGRVLESLDVLWFEEPVPPEDRVGYRRVRDALSISIAGGEAEFTRYGFRDLLAGQCVDIVQPDVCVSGGLSEFVKIHALANSSSVLTVPHVWGSGVALAAALHAVSTVADVPYSYAPVPGQNQAMIEFDQTPNPLRDELLNEEFVLESGHLRVPSGPGLGVTIDDAVLRRYSTQS
jgi:D-galactarolactone cycloisomerase